MNSLREALMKTLLQLLQNGSTEDRLAAATITVDLLREPQRLDSSEAITEEK